MTEQKVTQKQVDELIEDATYFQKEAEALQYVIDEVPYDESPPNERSIAEMLSLIDHAQINYFQPVFEDAIKKRRPTRLSNFDNFEKSFELQAKEPDNIQKLLHSLAKHRASLINEFNNTTISKWSTVIYDNNKELLLIDFIQRMIDFDKIQLIKIANLVMVYNQEQGTRREINRRQKRQNTQNETNS